MSVARLGVGAIATNQIMINPFSPQWVFDVADWCAKQGIVITAWAPLAGTTMETKKMLADTDLTALVGEMTGSAAQVVLRWALQRGFVIIPGSGNPEHQRENLNVYNVALGEAEMTKINGWADHKGYMYGGPPYMKD